jgi:hypothetical protein
MTWRRRLVHFAINCRSAASRGILWEATRRLALALSYFGMLLRVIPMPQPTIRAVDWPANRQSSQRNNGFLWVGRKSMLGQVPNAHFAALLLMTAVSASPIAWAAPQRLECTLTDTDAESAVERRSLAIIFDEETTTMKMQEGDRIRNLTDVSISTTSMSGGDAGMTIGVSRSSWRIVLQTYQRNSVRTEYGNCALDLPPPQPKLPSTR